MPEFDFSYFHPLDHAIWERVCRETPGGIRNHIQLWWAYEVDLVGPVRRQLFCRRDRHRPQPYWLGHSAFELVTNEEPTGYDCQDCGAPL